MGKHIFYCRSRAQAMSAYETRTQTREQQFYVLTPLDSFRSKLNLYAA